MNNFANIGKAVLIQSLGLQKNYIELAESLTEVIDYSNPACSSCKWKSVLDHFPKGSPLYETAYVSCDQCPKKVTTTETVYHKIYHNEKNRYGYKPRLKSNAIKLFLLLHFYNPDKFGIISNLDERILAEQLHCDLKTIRNNLNILMQYSYLSYSKIDKHLITILMTDYERYFLPAHQGGRGFFVLSKSLLFELLKIDNLVSLRIHLRELLDIDNLNVKGPITAVNKSYEEIRLSLPEYCKPFVIRQAIQEQNEIFSIDFKENSIRFEIKDEFNCRIQKEQFYEQYLSQFESFLQDFNQAVVAANIGNYISPQYSTFFECHSSALPDHFKLLRIHDFEFEDLAQLAVQFSYDLVIEALSQIYKSYILKDRKIINLGGLVRTAIVARYESKFSAA